MTNRQWLETLTDEELAERKISVRCESCAYNPGKGFCDNLSSTAPFYDDCCIDGIAKWLKMEHKGE